MATGYTYKVVEGQSFEDFALGCAKAFGALIHMRDEPGDAPITKREPSTYDQEALEESTKELQELETLFRRNELNKKALACFYESEKRRFESLKRKRKYRRAYNNMLDKVHSWQPPTSEHEKYKEFMLSQLTDSLKADCNIKYDLKPNIKLTAVEWYIAEKKRLEQDIEYHTKELEKEKERCNNSNEWVEKLKESLKNANK
jgi:hypothetical protein